MATSAGDGTYVGGTVTGGGLGPGNPWRPCAWPCAAVRVGCVGVGAPPRARGRRGGSGEDPASVACCPLWSFPLDREGTGGWFWHPRWEVERCLSEDQSRGKQRGGQAVFGYNWVAPLSLWQTWGLALRRSLQNLGGNIVNVHFGSKHHEIHSCS